MTKKQRGTREVALATVKDDLSKYLRLATREEIVITRHGHPAGVLIGFESDDDWLGQGYTSDFGLSHVKSPTWFLLQLEVYVNGQEWLGRNRHGCPTHV